jgi:23S rRNA (pseudouridine1915-N3)-methyltransferase
MRIHVIAIGRLKAGAERELVERYAGRFAAAGRTLGLTGPLLRELPESQARTGPERKGQEAAALLAAIPDAALAIRLDERGAMLSSPAFADLIAKPRDAGQRDLAFLIGGADGLGDEVAGRAPQAFCFGRMTLPHQIARVLLLEQLYRAATMLSGHPYHRA